MRAVTRARAGGAWASAVPVVAAAVATPLTQPVLYAFLGPGDISAGVAGLVLRIGALIVAALALHTYADLVRGPDRPVLDPHPVQPRLLLWAIAAGTARARVYLPLGAAVLLLPLVLAGHPRAWFGAVAVIWGAYVAGLGVGFAVHLGAVGVGFSPAVARALDLLRGDNPRMQAALIYAPGVALAVALGAVGLAAEGLRGALSGHPVGWVWMASPIVVGGLSFAAALPLADRYYVRATALLTEVDGLYAHRVAASGAQGPEPVYLEWAARGRPELLRALRQSWRAHRVWAVGGWLLGLSTLLAVWSDAVDVSARVLAVGGGGVLLLGALPLRLAAGDPAWLDRALGLAPRKVAVGRAAAAVLYAQGVVLPGLVGVVRHGIASVIPALVLVEGTAIAASVGAAALAAVAGARGPWIYGGAAVVGWAVLAGGFAARWLGLGGAA